MHLEQLEKRYRDSMDGKGLSKMVFPRDDHFAGLCVAEMRLPFLGMPSCPLVCPEHASPKEAQCSGSFMWATTALLVGYCHCFDLWDRCLICKSYERIRRWNIFCWWWYLYRKRCNIIFIIFIFQCHCKVQETLQKNEGFIFCVAQNR